MLQWTPGDGAPPVWDPCWYPLYHKTFEAGKKIHIAAADIEHLRALKREFGDKTKQMLIGYWKAVQPEEAEEILRIMEC